MSLYVPEERTSSGAAAVALPDRCTRPCWQLSSSLPTSLSLSLSPFLCEVDERCSVRLTTKSERILLYSPTRGSFCLSHLQRGFNVCWLTLCLHTVISTHDTNSTEHHATLGQVRSCSLVRRGTEWWSGPISSELVLTHYRKPFDKCSSWLMCFCMNMQEVLKEEPRWNECEIRLQDNRHTFLSSLIRLLALFL